MEHSYDVFLSTTHCRIGGVKKLFFSFSFECNDIRKSRSKTLKVRENFISGTVALKPKKSYQVKDSHIHP